VRGDKKIPERKKLMEKIEGIILDWAGTTVDFGCFAPVNAFCEIFSKAGVPVSVEEARKPMGLLKWDHIKSMLAMPRIVQAWQKEKGRPPDDSDTRALYAEFEPLLFQSLSGCSSLLPHVTDTVSALRSGGYKIGSTTGYTSKMMQVVAAEARARGYAPDCCVTPDDTGNLGRPYPYMLYRNMEQLKIAAPWRIVKAGDTASDIAEGLQAGAWSVGVIAGGSELGLSREEFNRLAPEDKNAKIEKTKEKFAALGAHFVIEDLRGLPPLIKEIDDLLSQGCKP
jgi:phosphonoacetaldehyde hydrolase